MQLPPSTQLQRWNVEHRAEKMRPRQISIDTLNLYGVLLRSLLITPVFSTFTVAVFDTTMFLPTMWLPTM